MTHDDGNGPDGDPSETGSVVEAAGGIVLTDGRSGLEVLVVHRPAYDDWSLPKGHVDPGEGPERTALREVAEETGVAATIVRAAGITRHPVGTPDAPIWKQVRWYVMRPSSSHDPLARPPDDEVDRAAWWPISTATQDLTYASERDLLRRAVATVTPLGGDT
jgi:8-oxo-(d)GTP phosphatase